MAIGDIIKNQFTEYTDEQTGAKVLRLTAPDHVSHHMYFYNRMTTSDGKRLLYCAQMNGQRQLYLMDLLSGDAVQLTEGEELDDYGGLISADDQSVYYQQSRAIWKLNISTLERECVYRILEGWNGGNWGMSDDNRYLAIVETLKSSVPPRKSGAGWDFFAETCRAKPHCRIVYADLSEGSFHTVLEDDCWFGHAQIRPGDPDTILFCHEGPYDLIDARLWLVQSDGSNYRCCRQQPRDLILTHEFWLPDGSALAFVYRETTGEKIENIRFINPETMEEEIFMPCSPYAHFICDAGNRYMVGDAQGNDVPIHLLKETDKPAGDTLKSEVCNDFIYLVDIEQRRERKLCYHGTSWRAVHGNPQDSHPHPCFTQDGRYVIFVSDLESKPCVYMTEVEPVR